MHIRSPLLVLAACGMAAPLLAGEDADPGSARDAPAVVVDPQTLAGVRDRTIGIPYEERGAYYQVLHHAQRVPPAAQKEAARAHRLARIEAAHPRFRDRPHAFSAFVDLFRNPQEYRGKPVTLRGHIRKCIAYPADENDYGIETLYEAWLFAEDAQQNPAVVISTSVPAGMPLGEHIQEHVAVTGYFFKMFGYDAQDTTRVAPMLLAERLEWTPAAAGPSFETPPVLYGLAAALLVAMVWLVWRLGRKDREFRKRLPRTAEASKPDFTGIDE